MFSATIFHTSCWPTCWGTSWRRPAMPGWSTSPPSPPGTARLTWTTSTTSPTALPQPCRGTTTTRSWWTWCSAKRSAGGGQTLVSLPTQTIPVLSGRISPDTQGVDKSPSGPKCSATSPLQSRTWSWRTTTWRGRTCGREPRPPSSLLSSQGWKRRKADSLLTAGTGTSFSASEAWAVLKKRALILYLKTFYRDQTDPKVGSGLWERSAKLVAVNL